MSLLNLPFSVIVIVSLLQISAISAQSIEIFKFLECAEPIENDALTITFKEDPPRADAVLDTQYEINEDDMVEIFILQNQNDQWVDAVDSSNTVEQYISKFLNGAWEKIQQQSDPPIEGIHLDIGKYTWTDVELAKEDVVPPSGLDGLLRAEVTVYSGDQPVFCIAGEGQINP